MVPGLLFFISGFYMLLHCWHNAFAEILQFSDKKFYMVKIYSINITFLYGIEYFSNNTINILRTGGQNRTSEHFTEHGTLSSMIGYTHTYTKKSSAYLENVG